MDSKLHHRPDVKPSRVQKVIDDGKGNDGACNQNAVIHRLCRRRRHGRPETEEEDDEHIHASEGVDHDAEDAGHSPRAPC